MLTYQHGHSIDIETSLNEKKNKQTNKKIQDFDMSCDYPPGTPTPIQTGQNESEKGKYRRRRQQTQIPPSFNTINNQ